VQQPLEYDFAGPCHRWAGSGSACLESVTAAAAAAAKQP